MNMPQRGNFMRKVVKSRGQDNFGWGIKWGVVGPRNQALEDEVSSLNFSS